MIHLFKDHLLAEWDSRRLQVGGVNRFGFVIQSVSTLVVSTRTAFHLLAPNRDPDETWIDEALTFQPVEFVDKGKHVFVSKLDPASLARVVLLWLGMSRRARSLLTLLLLRRQRAAEVSCCSAVLFTRFARLRSAGRALP